MPSEEDLWKWMMEGKYPPGYPGVKPIERRALATLARDIKGSKWMGHDKPEKPFEWPAGTRIKVVMASRLGDVGITDDLKAQYGYHYRVQCIEDEQEFDGTKIKFVPANLLINIEYLD